MLQTFYLTNIIINIDIVYPFLKIFVLYMILNRYRTGFKKTLLLSFVEYYYFFEQKLFKHI